MYSGYTGRTCNIKPPCPPRYESFRMMKGGPLCCRLKSHDKGCPTGQFRCPVTNRCVCLKRMKVCKTQAEWRRRVVQELSPYAVVIGGKRRLPTFATTLSGICGRCKEEKLEKARIVLATCKKNGIPITRVDGEGFKGFSTLKSQCKAYFTACGKAGGNRRKCVGEVAGGGAQTPKAVDDNLEDLARSYTQQGARDMHSAARHERAAGRVADPRRAAVHQEEANILKAKAKNSLTAADSFNQAASARTANQKKALALKGKRAAVLANRKQATVDNVRAGSGVKRIPPPAAPGARPAAARGRPAARPAAARGRPAASRSPVARARPAAARPAAARSPVARRPAAPRGTRSFGFGNAYGLLSSGSCGFGKGRYTSAALTRDLRVLQNMF